MEAEMFDAIGVSERTQKPWTVVVSFIGQMAVIGLAILAPLVGTDALPHRLSWISLPEPPRALPHRPAAAAAAKQTSMVPPQFTPKGLVLPRRIPDKPTILQDPDSLPAASDGVGVPGGFGNSPGSGNGVIDSLVRSASVAAPPPPPVVIREASKPIPRITVGGNVQKGKLISGPRPNYPPLAKQARVSGIVRLQAVISRDGTILDLRAVSGHPLLIPAALAAVAHWVFSPTYLNGDPVEVATDIEVTFSLQ
jgi:protein TonB